MAQNIDSVLMSRAKTDGQRPALRLADQVFTYAELDAAVESLAGRLRAGHQSLAGQRIGILAPNVPALVVGLFAAWRCGAIAVPVPARWREYELSHALPIARLAALATVRSHRGFSFEELLPRIAPRLRVVTLSSHGEILDESGLYDNDDEPMGGDMGAILFTSGTTGEPRGALVPHARELSAAKALSGVLRLTPEDVCVQVPPISHSFGLSCLLATLFAGGQAVLIDSTISIGPTVDAISRHQATVLYGSPSLILSLLTSQDANLQSLRTGLVAGSICPPDVPRRLDERGIRLLNVYGMTEIGAAACCRWDDEPEVRYTSVGRPLPGYEFRVSEGGELQVRSPHIRGYFGHASYTPSPAEWLDTGDAAFIDPAGNIGISGRLKDVIQVGGLSVFPAEVEGLLLTHPDIEQCAVVGVPHPAMGEAIHAFVVSRDGATPSAADVLRFARFQIAGYKLPYKIEVVTELPALPSGKTDRRELVRRAGEKQC
jgi:acyl-CoA synthetase (AMP-forming)/AMP-acid ligase II